MYSCKKRHSIMLGVLQCVAVQSGPENTSVNLDLLYSKTKTFVCTDLSAFFQLGTVQFKKPVA